MAAVLAARRERNEEAALEEVRRRVEEAVEDFRKGAQ